MPGKVKDKKQCEDVPHKGKNHENKSLVGPLKEFEGPRKYLGRPEQSSTTYQHILNWFCVLMDEVVNFHFKKQIFLYLSTNILRFFPWISSLFHRIYIVHISFRLVLRFSMQFNAS